MDISKLVEDGARALALQEHSAKGVAQIWDNDLQPERGNYESAARAAFAIALAEDAAGLCERLEKRAAFWERYWTGRSLQDPDSGPIREAAALLRSLSLRVEAEKRAREEAERERREEELREDARLGAALARAESAEAHSAALARALEELSAKVDAFWNDPERPSVHRMRSKSVHELSDAQRRARSLLAPKEDTDA